MRVCLILFLLTCLLPGIAPRVNAATAGASAYTKAQPTPAQAEEGTTEEAATEKEKAVERPAQTITDRASEQLARQEAAKLDRARAYQTPVMVRGSRVMVPVEISRDGKTAHLMMLLDDKAPTTVIHRTAVEELRFPPGEQVTLTGTGNRAVKAEKVLAGLIDIGPFELRNYPVVLITPQGGTRSFDGTLGIDFLKDHPYTVDFDREMLRWQQPGK
jgi:hypothetical protein